VQKSQKLNKSLELQRKLNRYEVKGIVKKGKDFKVDFKTFVFGYSLKHATDVILSRLGSNYKVKRKNIIIEYIKEVKENEQQREGNK
jgi:ribosomal protein L20A (L18A)